MIYRKVLFTVISCILTLSTIQGSTVINVHAKDSGDLTDSKKELVNATTVSNSLEKDKIIASEKRLATGLKDAKILSPEDLFVLSSDMITGIKVDVDKATIIDLVIPEYIGSVRTRWLYPNAFEALPNLKTIVIEENAMRDGFGNYSVQNCPNLESVTIESTVRQINKYAFAKCKKLKTFTFKDGLETIQQDAFSECEGLIEIGLPDSVTTIGTNAFNGCKNVKKIRIPENATYKKIERGTFAYMDSLEEINIPSTLTTIGERAFFGAKSLSVLDIPNSINRIEGSAFYYTSIETLVIPDSVIFIGERAFTASKKLKSVVWGKGATTLQNYVLGYCPLLKSVTLPNTVVAINEGAFRQESADVRDNVGLEKIDIPGSVSSIGMSAFEDNSLREINFENASKITFASGSKTSFGSQNIPITLYHSKSGYYLDFEQSGIKQWKDILMGSTSGAQFTLIEEGIFKLNDSSQVPATITYKYNAAEGKVNSQVSGINVTPNIKKVYETTFKEDDGSIISTSLTLEQEEVKFPSVEKKEGYTAVWDEGVITELNRVFTLSYKAIPKLEGKSEVSIAFNNPFVPDDHFKFIDADGNIVDDVIFEGTVNTEQPGTYLINYTATDKWGGITKGKVTVIVKDKEYIFKELVDKKTNIKVSGMIVNEGKLIVELIKNDDNHLTQFVDEKHSIIGSYEVRIIGEYKGKISITFPIEEKYEGLNIYIKHLKKDGTIEDYTKISKNGEIILELDDLSPFLLTVDKKEIVNPDQPTKPVEPEKPISPEDPIKPSQPEKPTDKVETSDTTMIEIMNIIALLSLLSITIFNKKRTQVK